MKRTVKQFVIRKYVLANSAAQAIRKERSLAVDDVWVDEEWKKTNITESNRAVGFKKRAEKRLRYK